MAEDEDAFTIGVEVVVDEVLDKVEVVEEAAVARVIETADDFVLETAGARGIRPTRMVGCCR